MQRADRGIKNSFEIEPVHHSISDLNLQKDRWYSFANTLESTPNTLELTSNTFESTTLSAVMPLLTEPTRPTPFNEKRILLVEDDDANRQMLGDYLALHGYTIRGVATGAEFSSALSQFCPSIILMDLKLPDVSGYKLLTDLSGHPTWSSIPVIVVSAYAFKADQRKAMELGASQYFVKPVDLEQLINAIETAFQE
ncbi:MAG: response regulator [Cyanobacteria bacterium P01_E01_bin.6]